MTRLERKNIIRYIELRKKIDRDQFLIMTDADIQHIYETIYYQEQNTYIY